MFRQGGRERISQNRGAIHDGSALTGTRQRNRVHDQYPGSRASSKGRTPSAAGKRLKKQPQQQQQQKQQQQQQPQQHQPQQLQKKAPVQILAPPEEGRQPPASLPTR
ncbi:hypothetical protein MTO96_010442 [Rhipicephalus appendiculatus]